MKSIVAFPDNYVVIDIETTGFNKWNEIIELGALRIRNGNIVDTFQQLVKPEDYIPDYVVELTGITNEMVCEAPTIDLVAASFRDFVGDDIIVGHNTNFDLRFFNQCAGNFVDILDGEYVDTMRLARKAIPGYEHYRLCDIAKALFIAQSNAHRALADCETTHFCLQALKKIVCEQYDNFDEFKKLFAKKHKSSSARMDLRTIKADVAFFDEECPIFEKNCVFTGKLERFTRTKAAQIVANLGGYNQNQLTKSTDYLILGNGDFFKESKSTKQKKAEALLAEGFSIQIINEDMFYEIINDYYLPTDKNYDTTLDYQILEVVKRLLEPELLKNASLTLQTNAENTNYCTIISSISPNTYHTSSASHFFARTKTNGQKCYIAFNNNAKRLFDSYGISCEYEKSASEDFYRMSLETFDRLASDSVEFKKALNEFFIKSFDFSSFGCCSRYKKCSEIGKCQHEDIIYASAACQYKKNLDKGNNFLK